MPFFTQDAYLTANAEDIDLEAEDGYPVFRFNDFTPTAQDKFVAWLKEDSSVRTIRERAKEYDIKRVLKDLNPILIRPGWKGTFSYSTIFRWKEQAISSMVFNSLFRRRPRSTGSWRYRMLLTTPDEALERFRDEFTCIDCDQTLPVNFRSPDYDICQSCYNADREKFNDEDWPVVYANKSNDIECESMSRMWCGDRPSLLRRKCYQLGLRMGNLRSRWRKHGLVRKRHP